MTSEEEAIETLFASVGKFIVLFQSLEDQVDEFIRLARGFEAREETSVWLDKVSFGLKVLEANKEIERYFSRLGDGALFKDYQSLQDNLISWKNTRNQIVHARYLYDFLELGGDIAVIDPKNREDGIRPFEPDEMERTVRKLAQFQFHFGQAKIQLIHLIKD